MTITVGLADFLLARIGEDQAAALAALEPESPGKRWQWVATQTDTVVAPGELAEAQEHQPISLRTVEEFPTRSVGPLPGFLIYEAEQVSPGAGEHIARWDVARVLAECEAKRSMIGRLRTYEDVVTDLRFRDRQDFVGRWSEWDMTARFMGLIYVDHPDYRPEWRP